MCVAGVGWAAVLIGALLDGRRLVPTGVAVIVAGVLVLPGFTAGVIGNQRVVRGRQPQSGWIRSVWAPPELPRWGLALTGVIDYSAIGGLSNEMVERLNGARPADLAAAGRIRGITPAALAAIMVYARRRAA